MAGPANYIPEFLAFYEAVVSGDRSPSFAQESFEDLRVIDAALRSAQTMETVALA